MAEILRDGTSHSDDARTVDVTRVVDVSAFRGLPLVVSICTVLALVFDGFDVQAAGFVAPALMQEWGIERSSMGPVLAAALVGMAIGSVAIGPAGDRFGRRAALVFSMIAVAIGSLLCAIATTPEQLTIYRFITGLGLGGSVPNATALMAEMAPLAIRNLVVSITVVGVPIGGVVGAEAAAHLLPAFGWRSVFIAGSILPAVLALAMWLYMPESPRYLAQRPKRYAELARTLNRLARTDRYSASDVFVVPEQAAGVRKEGLGTLLSAAFRRDTLLVWLAFLCSAFCVYMLFNWLPTVLSSKGLPITAALRGALVMNLGGVLGAVVMAAGMNRFGSRRVLIAFGVLAIATMMLLAFLPGDLYRSDQLLGLLLLMGPAGLAILGVQVGLYSLAAHVYPTVSRASGVGAALAVGRAGGILSAFVGGLLMSIGAGGAGFFVGTAVAVLLMAAAVGFVTRQIPPTAEVMVASVETQPGGVNRPLR